MKKKNLNTIISEIMPKKLKEYRKKAGFSIEEVSKKIHKTPPMITNYEKGISIPPASILYELCRIYGIEDINEVFTNFIRQDFKCDEYLTKSEYELVQLWRSASKEARNAAKIVLKAYAKIEPKKEDEEPCTK